MKDVKVRPLRERGILVKVETHAIGNARKDNIATKEVAQQHGGDERTMGAYVKNLFHPDALKTINSLKNQLIGYVKGCGIPWPGSEGWVFLPTEDFPTYRENVSKLRQKYNDEVDKFVAKYDELVKEAETRLGDLFDSNQYPPSEEIKMRFKITPRVQPVPDGEDFKIDISEEEMSELKKLVKEQHEEAMKEGMNLIWNRLHNYVKRVVETLNKPDRETKKGTLPPIFHKSMLDNLKGLVPMLTKLNITDDPKMEEMRRNLEKSIIMGTDAQQLRDDPVLRKQVKAETTAFLDSFPDEVKEN